MSKNTSPLREGVPDEATISATSNKRTGALCERLVGYDRFAGEPTYRQLTELYRALRVYVNCFQPSMKLQMKEREGSKVRRTYDQAQTPSEQAPCLGCLVVKKAARVAPDHRGDFPHCACSNNSNTYRKHVFRHVVKLEAEKPEDLTPLPFSVSLCTEERVPASGIPGTPPSLLKQQRKRKYQKPGRPRDWRTRKDPFEGEWEQITTWLLANPELTGVDIFHQLEQASPGRYRPTQVRTDTSGSEPSYVRVSWSPSMTGGGEEVINGHSPSPTLRVEVLVGVS